MGWFDKKRGRRASYVSPKIYTRTSRDVNISFNPIYIWIVLVLILIGLLVWWLFFSDFFKIKEIAIDGAINESIKTEIDQFYGQNIFLFTVGAKDKELAEKQTSIEKLNIIKGIPDMLKIEILVRKPVIRWKSQDKIYYIDDEGIVFNLENETEEYNDLPLVNDAQNLDAILGNKMVTDDFVQFVLDLKSQMSEKIKDKEIEEIRINETTLNLEIQLKDSYKVYFDTIGDLSKQIEILGKIIEKHDKDIHEYVDLRVENKGYYK